jgi:hypothetical protein
VCRRVQTPLVGIIEEYLVVFSREEETLCTLDSISEARIARHGLPAGLMARMKASVKTQRQAATGGYLTAFFSSTLALRIAP